MTFIEYIESLPTKRKLSEVKLQILKKLWSNNSDSFPKPWVSSKELLELTGQKYFDRRARELRDQLGCDIETEYRESFTGHGWRIRSDKLAPPHRREYLTQQQKETLFAEYDYCCAICGVNVVAGVRGLQADHKIPLSRGGGNELNNWQPICNNCNVGKRRACDSCFNDCNNCSWAYPDRVGINTIVKLSEYTLRRVDQFRSATQISRSTVMEEAVEYFLDNYDKED